MKNLPPLPPQFPFVGAITSVFFFFFFFYFFFFLKKKKKKEYLFPLLSYQYSICTAYLFNRSTALAHPSDDERIHHVALNA